MKMLNAEDPLNTCHIMRLLNTFYFSKHFCMVLELCHSTLFHEMVSEKGRRKQLFATNGQNNSANNTNDNNNNANNQNNVC